MPTFHAQELRTIEEDIESSGISNNNNDGNANGSSGGGGAGGGAPRLQADQLRVLDQQNAQLSPPPVHDHAYLMMYNAQHKKKNTQSLIGSTRAVEAGHAGSIVSGGIVSSYRDDQASDEGEDGRVEQQLHEEKQQQRQQQTQATKAPAEGDGLKKNKTSESTLVGLKPDPQSQSRKKRIIVVIGIAIAIIIGIAIGVSYLVQAGVEENEVESEDTGAGGSVDPELDEKEAMLELLETELQQVTHPVDLLDQESPQFKARYWLLNEDTNLKSGSAYWRVRQRYSLVTLYYATAGENWSYDAESGEETFLNPLTNECTWPGIGCTESRVYIIDLATKGLSGQLPSEITLLRGLRELRLEDNYITGTMPQNVSLFSNLYYFDLSGNDLTGTIPSSIWRLQYLRFIFLSSNSLTGPIDSDQGEGTRSPFIQQIFLRNNILDGSIPSWIAQLQHLEHLLLRGNQLVGNLRDFDQARSDAPQKALASLSWLDLSTNNLTGSLPPQLIQYSSYPRLEHLYLNNNSLTGSLPDGRQRNVLKILRLNSNNFNGSISRNFGYNSNQLTELLLQDNAFTGIISQCSGDDFRHWPNMGKLVADCNLTCSCCTDPSCHTGDQ